MIAFHNRHYLTHYKSTPLLMYFLALGRRKAFSLIGLGIAFVKVYFCDFHSPWQPGANENTNRLLRQYFPRRTDLSCYAQSERDSVALRINQHPRKSLGTFFVHWTRPSGEIRRSHTHVGIRLDVYGLVNSLCSRAGEAYHSQTKDRIVIRHILCETWRIE